MTSAGLPTAMQSCELSSRLLAVPLRPAWHHAVVSVARKVVATLGKTSASAMRPKLSRLCLFDLRKRAGQCGFGNGGRGETGVSNRGACE